MKVKSLVYGAVFASGLVSSGLAMAASLGAAAGMSLGDTPPSQCQASGSNMCYHFVNDTNATGTMVAGGTTVSITLSGQQAACGGTQWSLTPGQRGWLWTNPSACTITGITLASVPGPTTPAITGYSMNSLPATGSPGSQRMILKMTIAGTTAVPALAVSTFSYEP